MQVPHLSRLSGAGPSYKSSVTCRSLIVAAGPDLGALSGGELRHGEPLQQWPAATAVGAQPPPPGPYHPAVSCHAAGQAGCRRREVNQSIQVFF